MAITTIFDLVPRAVPTYDGTLSVNPQHSLIEKGSKNQKIHIADDGSEEFIGKSSDVSYYFVLKWNTINEEDAGTILDLWSDPDKADGSRRSFKWVHPTDGHTYVVRFEGDIERSMRRGKLFGFASITLKVIGGFE
jgi:hypothetical protein